MRVPSAEWNWTVSPCVWAIARTPSDLTAMKGMGNGDLDHSGLVRLVEELAQQQISD
jgi:hypothetical protein